MVRYLRRIIILLIVVSPIVWIVGYFWATRTEAYSVAIQAIENDPVINAYFSGIDDYRMAFFDGFRYSSVGTDARAEFRFHVRGRDRSATVDLEIQRRLGRWMLVEGNLADDEGNFLQMTPRPLTQP